MNIEFKDIQKALGKLDASLDIDSEGWAILMRNPTDLDNDDVIASGMTEIELADWLENETDIGE